MNILDRDKGPILKNPQRAKWPETPVQNNAETAGLISNYEYSGKDLSQINELHEGLLKLWGLLRHISPDFENAMDSFIRWAIMPMHPKGYISNDRFRDLPKNMSRITDEWVKAEIRILIENIQKLRQIYPHVEVIAPFFMETKEAGVALQTFLLFLELWNKIPEAIWDGIDANEAPLQVMKTSIDINASHGTLILNDETASLWYGMPKVFRWENWVKKYLSPKGFQNMSENLIRHKVFPRIFIYLPFIELDKHEDSILLLEYVFFLPSWARWDILTPNIVMKARLTFIALIKKYRHLLMKDGDPDTTSLLAQRLIEALGNDVFCDMILKYWKNNEWNNLNLNPKSIKKRPPVKSQKWFISLKKIPSQATIEPRVTTEQVHQKPIDPQEEFLKTFSPEIHEYLMRKMLFEGQILSASLLVKNWPQNFPLLKLWISLDDGTNWQSFARDEEIHIKDFPGGNVTFAFSPAWEKPEDFAKRKTISFNKKVVSVQRDVPRRMDIVLSLPKDPIASVIPEAPKEKTVDEKVLELYGLFLAKNYLLETNPQGIVMMTLGAIKLRFREEIIEYVSGEKKLFDEFLDMASLEIKTIFLNAVTSIKEKKIEEILQKLNPWHNWMKTIMNALPTLDESLTLKDAMNSYEYNGGYMWVMILVNGFSERSVKIKDALRLLWPDIHFERVDEKGRPGNGLGTHLKISLSLEWNEWVVGTIRSTWKPDYFHTEIRPWVEKRIADSLMQMLQDILVFSWALAFQKYGKREKSIKRAESKFGRQESLTDEDITSLLTGNYKKQIRWLSSYSQWQRKLIMEAIVRFREWRWKLCLDQGFNHTFGYYEAHITSKQWQPELDSYSNADSNIWVVIVDEKLSSAWEKKWHSFAYDMMRDNPRLQKYLILKIIATLINAEYKWKSPFSNGMKEVFMNFWERRVSNEKKEEFLTSEKKNTESALQILMWEEGKSPSIIAALIEYWHSYDVQIIYSKPQILPLDEFLAIMEEMENKEIHEIATGQQ